MTTLQTVRDRQTILVAANDEGETNPARASLGSASAWLARLARLAPRGEAAGGDAAPVAPSANPQRNLCEFDYDYYVALQGRRRHAPARLLRG